MSRPVVEAIVAIALLSAMDALVKDLVGHLPVLQVTFLRYAAGTLLIGTVLLAVRPPRPSAESLKANAARALLVVLTATTFFFALGRLPLAEVLILSFLSPISTALLASLLLGERPDRRIAAAIAAGSAGVLLVVGGGFGAASDGSAAEAGRVAGIAAVLVSAVGYSASNVLLRSRARHDPVVTIVAIQNVAPCGLLLVPALAAWTWPSPRDWAVVAGIGTLGAAGHLLLARAYGGAEATRLAPLEYTALIWAVLLGYLAFGEVPGPAAIAGAALIVGSAILVGRRRAG